MASESKVVVEWPFQENGAERIYTAFVVVGVCHLKSVLKSVVGQNGLRAVRMG